MTVGACGSSRPPRGTAAARSSRYNRPRVRTAGADDAGSIEGGTRRKPPSQPRDRSAATRRRRRAGVKTTRRHSWRRDADGGGRHGPPGRRGSITRGRREHLRRALPPGKPVGGRGAGDGARAPTSRGGGGNKFLPAQRRARPRRFPRRRPRRWTTRGFVCASTIADATGRGGGDFVCACQAAWSRAGVAFGSAAGADGERGWTEARKETEELLLAVLKNRSSARSGEATRGSQRAV